MKTKIILFDNLRLNLDFMSSFLEKNKLTKAYEILACSQFDELEKYIPDQDSILILNSIGLKTQFLTNDIEKYLQINPSLKIIIHSVTPDIKLIKKFFDKGIKSFLGSQTSIEEFLEALEQVISGNIFLSDHTKNLLVECLCHPDNNGQQDKNHFGSEDITTREKDVLQLICEGFRSKEIAEKLFISPHTVESHRRNMMLKFDINNSSKLVKFAIENRLVEY